MADILKPGWKRSQATTPGTTAYTDPSGRRVVHQHEFPNTVPLLSRQGLRQYVADPLRSMAGTPTLADLGYFPRGLRRPSMNPALAENQPMPNVAAPGAVATPNMSALSAPGALRTLEFRRGRDDTPLNGPMLQNLPAAIVPGTPNPNTYLQNAGGLASDEKVAGYLDDFRTSELARRDARASSLQRYNQRLADENSAGRLNASRNTYYGGDFPMSGGSAVAPYGAVAGAVRQGGMSGLPPEGYFRNALIEVPPERVAPEMQQFVNDQNRFNSATGQSLPNNQDGLTPGNPWFDNTPRPRGPANAYGLSRMPQVPIATPEQAATGQDMPLARYGESVLRRIGGKNVLVGKRGDVNIPNGDVRGAIRKAQETPEYKAQIARNAEYSRLKNGPKRARNEALRQAALDRRLMQMGSPPMDPKKRPGSGGITPLTLADRQELLNPENQESLRQSTGVRPGTDVPETVLKTVEEQFAALDPSDTEGRQAILKVAQGALADPKFGSRGWLTTRDGNLAAIKSLKELVQDPDAYMRKKKAKKQTPPPQTQPPAEFVDPQFAPPGRRNGYRQ